MAASDWDTVQDGTVELYPMVDWRIASMGLVVGLRLSTAHLQDGQPQVQHLQVGMPPDEARRFAEAICLAAKRIEDSLGKA